MEISYCEPEFVPIGHDNGFRHINPVYFIVGKDSEMDIDVPEFKLTEVDCLYKKKTRSWVESVPKYKNDDIEILPLPDNIRFFYSLNDELRVDASHLEISGQSWDDPEDLIGTNVTLHFQAYVEGGFQYAESDILNLTIIYVELGDEPGFLNLDNLDPEFLHDQWAYTVEQNSTIEFTL